MPQLHSFIPFQFNTRSVAFLSKSLTKVAYCGSSGVFERWNRGLQMITNRIRKRLELNERVSWQRQTFFVTIDALASSQTLFSRAGCYFTSYASMWISHYPSKWKFYVECRSFSEICTEIGRSTVVQPWSSRVDRLMSFRLWFLPLVSKRPCHMEKLCAAVWEYWDSGAKVHSIWLKP